MRKLFQKELVVDSPTGAGEVDPNPYLDARRHWNSQVDRAFSGRHALQLLVVASLLVGLGGVAGVIYVGSQSKYVPYVIEVDKLGEAVAVGPAQPAAPADQRVVRASLASFVSSARLVTPDLDVQRRAVFTVYAMLKTKDPGTVKMNEYLNGSEETSVFNRSKKVTVSTDIETVLPISSTAWQVEWQETTRDRDGSMIGRPIPMRAVLEVYTSPTLQARESDIQRNPLGIYVRDFNWQQR
jgi:type IV secretion system protein VirB5